jgi:hypothetical protein
LPRVDELGLDGVEQVVDRAFVARLPRRRRIGDELGDTVAFQPGVGGRVLTVGQRVEQVTA